MAAWMEIRARLQVAEALGPLNRWYCAKWYGRRVDDPNLLLRYYIENGGAADFARRFAQATAPENRWYCSEFHHRDVRDAQMLWEYYNSTAFQD